MCAVARGLPIIGCMLDLIRWKADISPLFQKHGKHFLMYGGFTNPTSRGLFCKPILAVGCSEDVTDIVTHKADVFVPMYSGAHPRSPQHCLQIRFCSDLRELISSSTLHDCALGISPVTSFPEVKRYRYNIMIRGAAYVSETEERGLLVLFR